MVGEGMEQGQYLLRFGLGERIAHWCHAATYFMLFFTGLFLFIPSLRLIGNGEYIEPVITLHNLVAVFFLFLPIIIAILINCASLIANVAEVFRWRPADAQWAREFHREFLGSSPATAAVGKFNPGQKVHVFATFFLVLGLALTGIIMWLAHEKIFPQWLVNFSFVLHRVLTFVYLPMLAGHIYLAVGHPGTRESIRGMWGGKVSSSYAAVRHRAWYEQTLSKLPQKAQRARSTGNNHEK